MKKTFLIISFLFVLCVSAVLVGTTNPAPVAEAAMRGDRSAVQSLLKAGTDVNVPLSDGMTALHYAASLGDAKMAEMLLYAGANPNAKTRINAYTPLHLASETGSAAVVTLLLDAGADVNARTSVSGVMPIHLAASSGDIDTVNALLAKGADPNAREAKWQQTPLIFAAADNRAAVIPALLARGADPNIASKGTAFPAAPARGAAGRGAPTAARGGAAAPAAPQRGAVQQQAQPAANGEAPVGRGAPGMGGLTPLHHAARQGNLAAVRSLLDGGANINETSFDSSTPLTIAVLNSQFDVALELIKRGADVNKPLTYVNAGPLWLTINAEWQPRTRFPQPQEGGYQKASYLDVVSALLDAGADPNAKVSGHPFFMEYTDCGNARCGLEDMTGSTPFMRAAYSLDVPAMKLLVSRGANFKEGITVAAAGRGGAAGQRGGNAAPAAPGTAAVPPRPAVPTGPVLAIHYVAGEGYGEGFAGNAHVHAPDAWMSAMKYVVEELHQDVNARDALGMTALHHAAARGDKAMIMYLIAHGADVTAVSAKGQTVADMANSPVSRISPMPDIVALLQALGSSNSHKCTQC